MSEPAAAGGLDGTLSALADPVRRRAVELLAAGPRRAGELAAALDTTPSTMSKHLRVLRQCGLVAETHPEFDARVRIYTLRSAPMTELRRWIDTAEQAWAGQLTAFAAHLERDLRAETDLPADRDLRAESDQPAGRDRPSEGRAG